VLERHPKVNFIGQARAWWCNVEEFLKRHQDKLLFGSDCNDREADEAVAL
jgi:hypothetical protein